MQVLCRAALIHAARTTQENPTTVLQLWRGKYGGGARRYQCHACCVSRACDLHLSMRRLKKLFLDRRLGGITALPAWAALPSPYPAPTCSVEGTDWRAGAAARDDDGGGYIAGGSGCSAEGVSLLSGNDAFGEELRGTWARRPVGGEV